MRTLVFAALLTVASTVGCKKKEDAPPPAPPPKPAGASIESAVAPAEPAPPTPATPAPTAAAPTEGFAGDKVEDQLPTAPPGSAKTFPIHQALTATVRNYQMDTGKLPADFNTLVRDKYIEKIPTPPPGKKFALDRAYMQIVTIDR
jgi:hypothetical protein